jgi:glycogen synthase
MRVLFWSGTFWPHIGGVQVLASKILPALRERGYEFIVVASKTHAELPDEDRYRGIKIYRFSFHAEDTHKSIDHLVEVRQQVAALKREFAPRLVHVNIVGLDNLFHLTTANAHRAPTLVTLHGRWMSQSDSIVGNTLRAADWVAGCSAAILNNGKRLVPEITPRSSIIYNGVEAPSIEPTPLPFDAPRLLCLGRLHREKGMDVAVVAFATIARRFPRARLILAGDGAARSDLEQQVADLGIGHAVEFVGWVAPDRVPALINDATILLMPSRDDSLPLVALEAAWMARPIIAARVGGMPEVVVHQETGLLFESENAGDLADAASFMLENPQAAIRMGQAARRRVQKVFSWEGHVDAYDALYRRLIDQGSSAKDSPSSARGKRRVGLP